MELDFRQRGPISMHCENQSAIYIAQNLIFHEKIKHIKIDCHFVRDAWTKKVVTFQFTPSLKKLVHLLTKAVSPQVFSNLYNKLGMLDIYTLAWEGVLSGLLVLSYWVYWVVTHMPSLSSIYTSLIPMNKTNLFEGFYFSTLTICMQVTTG